MPKKKSTTDKEAKSCGVGVGCHRQSRGGSIYSCRSGEVEGGSYRGDVPSTLVSLTPVDERLPPAPQP